MNFKQIRQEIRNFGTNNPLLIMPVPFFIGFSELRRPTISFFTYLYFIMILLVVFIVLQKFFKLCPQAQQYFRPKSVLIFNSIFALFGILLIIVAVFFPDPTINFKAYLMEAGTIVVFFGNFLYFGLKK